MTSERPYRTALLTDEARERLLDARSSQFDPAIVRNFLTILDRSNNEYVEGTHADFAIQLRELATRTNKPELIAV
jgi:HD-GYP domain-containing protein (c-di-GMP phosphodiesterase class II)